MKRISIILTALALGAMCACGGQEKAEPEASIYVSEVSTSEVSVSSVVSVSESEKAQEEPKELHLLNRPYNKVTDWVYNIDVPDGLYFSEFKEYEGCMGGFLLLPYKYEVLVDQEFGPLSWRSAGFFGRVPVEITEIVFENGVPSEDSILPLENHSEDVTVGVLESSGEKGKWHAIIRHENHDLYTLSALGELEDSGTDMSEVQTNSDYWAFYFVKEGADVYYYLTLTSRLFSLQAAKEVAKSVTIIEDAPETAYVEPGPAPFEERLMVAPKREEVQPEIAAVLYDGAPLTVVEATEWDEEGNKVAFYSREYTMAEFDYFWPAETNIEEGGYLPQEIYWKGYTIVDIDQDGQNELVYYYSIDEAPTGVGDFLVFSVVDGEVYAYLIIDRDCFPIMDDGTMSAAFGASDGIDWIIKDFRKDGYNMAVLAHLSSEMGDTAYYVGDKKVSFEEYRKYLNEERSNRGALWTAVEEEDSWLNYYSRGEH